MRSFFRLVLVGLVVGLTGCAIHQTVRPVEGIADHQICVIENPPVKAGFIEAYKRSLTNKGYEVRQLPASAPITACTITSTYSANWRWDLALYMAYAEIRVFSAGKFRAGHGDSHSPRRPRMTCAGAPTERSSRPA